MSILIGLFAWRTWMLVVFVDVGVGVGVAVAVVFINDGDDVAAATRFEISVIIAVVIADGIRNNIDISEEAKGKECKIQHRARIGCCVESLN